MADMLVSAADRQPSGAVRSYAVELLALVRRLDPAYGWFAVFAEHDPDGLRECLCGREMPPWDVVASLLDDLGRLHGPDAAQRAEERLRPLHGAAVAEYDLHAGGEPVLRRRLAAAAGELEEAAAHLRTLEADGGAEQMWARDYLERVEARCAELRGRLAAVAAVPGDARPPERPAHDSAPAPGPDSAADAATPPGAAPAPPPPKRRARTGGSRFAGAPGQYTEDARPAAIVPPGAPSPDLAPRSGDPAADDAAAAAPGGEPASGELTPRGARFAGAVPPPPTAPGPSREQTAAARVLADQAAARLIRLRRAGSGGEAHALLCEAAHWPALRLAVLVDELHGRGLSADADTLLWEAAALPSDAFAAAASALAALGRGEDGARLLRQGVARPPGQIADAALALHGDGRDREAKELLAAVIRTGTPAGAAQVVRAAPAVLVRLLLEAAGAMSHEQWRRVASALRTAEVPGVPRAR
ncbi:hypothetical protein [Streptomyces marispadix]|uniref:UL36 very large tegument protein n=1 Tax=Streptomyces marispadix TaxID=2922868 RepID=A0ABS9T4B3_9ACTN|nr:hypothetical protein [Streptomyces marispadix]MCH6163379.1 hypothetical protein [Streptomyces marispadix]